MLTMHLVVKVRLKLNTIHSSEINKVPIIILFNDSARHELMYGYLIQISINIQLPITFSF